MPWAEHIPRCINVGDLGFSRGTGEECTELFLGTLSVYGHPLSPCALSDARGNVNIVMACLRPQVQLKDLR